MSDLTLLLAALAVLLPLAQLFGAGATRLGQPAVIGEIACGLVIGVVLPTGQGLPAPVNATLDAFAQLGLTLFLFSAGARLAPSMTARSARAAFVPALGAALVPFALGGLLALWLAQRHAPAGRGVFVLFAAAAMAVTAFPVLARILAERGILDSADGQRALCAAALTDAAAWTALAVVAGSLHSGTRAWTLIMVVPIAAVLCGLARSGYRRWAARLSPPVARMVMVVLACAGAAATDAIGLHAALGAFLAGAAIGRATASGHERSAATFDPAALVAPAGSLLVPLYFVLVGRKVDLGRLDLRLAGETAAIIAVAVVGKYGGAYLGARLAGHPVHSAALFATLMNTRGVTELVFLGIGLGLGVIDSAFYAAMVAMALVTTAMTGPLLTRLHQPDKVA